MDHYEAFGLSHEASARELGRAFVRPAREVRADLHDRSAPPEAGPAGPPVWLTAAPLLTIAVGCGLIAVALVLSSAPVATLAGAVLLVALALWLAASLMTLRVATEEEL